MTPNPQHSQSSYLPTEIDFPEDNKLFREILTKRERLTASILNVKENAQYEKSELLSGQQWFSGNSGGAIKTSYTYRLTFDLVALNGANIGAGATTLSLSSSTIPASISVPTNIQPVHGFGAASNGTTIYFINDPLVFVNMNVWTSSSQQITITNNSGSDLTQCVFCFEYIKT